MALHLRQAYPLASQSVEPDLGQSLDSIFRSSSIYLGNIIILIKNYILFNFNFKIYLNLTTLCSRFIKFYKDLHRSCIFPKMYWVYKIFYIVDVEICDISRNNICDVVEAKYDIVTIFNAKKSLYYFHLVVYYFGINSSFLFWSSINAKRDWFLNIITS